ncbi:hypothetical protein D3C86_1767060 [compost metagenome]
MRTVVPDPVDRPFWHEGLDIDGAGAFQRHRVDLVILQQHIIVFAARKTLHLVPGGDRPVGDTVDIAAFDAIAGFAIEDVEAVFVAFGRRRRQRDGGRHQ